MSTQVKIGILGAYGRIGRMLIDGVMASSAATLTGASEMPGASAIGSDAGGLCVVPCESGVMVSDDTGALFAGADAVIDFTSPGATALHAGLAAENGTALVIGTTGLGDEQQAALENASKKTVIVQAANFSIGVNLLLGLVEQAANVLSDEYDIEISDFHHRHKADAPSGTALALGNAAAKGRGVNLSDKMVTGRDGITGERGVGDIGMAVFRGGDVVGEHTVMFAGSGERVELTHKASSREIFASGALRAAIWANGKTPGLYSMKDVLGF